MVAPSKRQLAEGESLRSKAITLLGGGGTFLADATTFSTLSGGITGVGSFTKSGAGVLFLTATNTFTGGTTISGGALLIGNGERAAALLEMWTTTERSRSIAATI